MIALIHAAGYGTRLGKETKEMPKPMVEVGGVPCLDRIVTHLRSFGIEDIFVRTHYKAEKIFNHFGESLTYLHEPVLCDPYEREQWFVKTVAGDVVALNGDTLTDISIDAMAEYCKTYNVSVSSFEKTTYTGITYYAQKHLRVLARHDFSCSWLDIGTPESLEVARKQYADKVQ